MSQLERAAQVAILRFAARGQSLRRIALATGAAKGTVQRLVARAHILSAAIVREQGRMWRGRTAFYHLARLLGDQVLAECMAKALDEREKSVGGVSLLRGTAAELRPWVQPRSGGNGAARRKSYQPGPTPRRRCEGCQVVVEATPCPRCGHPWIA